MVKDANDIQCFMGICGVSRAIQSSSGEGYFNKIGWVICKVLLAAIFYGLCGRRMK